MSISIKICKINIFNSIISIILLKNRLRFIRMVLYIESLNENKVFKLDNCNMNSLVSNVKNDIQSEEHIPFDEQVLYYNNQIMDDHKYVW